MRDTCTPQHDCGAVRHSHGSRWGRCACGASVVGLDGALVDVEVDVSNGQPGFTIVGQPDAAVQEARERVCAAIKNSSLAYPFDKRITVSLAPADLRKEGPAYDLPIAVGLLTASEQLRSDLAHSFIIGELSLDGVVRHTNDVFPMAALAQECTSQRLDIPAADDEMWAGTNSIPGFWRMISGAAHGDRLRV